MAADRWSSIFRSQDPEVARVRLREALASPGTWPVTAPSIFDAASARIAEQVGFDTVVLSGYGVSVSRLGLPDAGFLSLGDISAVVHAISARTHLAIIADCDTGYGNALSAMRAAEEMIAAGAAALFIEDQEAPKRCGHVAGKIVIPAEEFAGKLRAIDRVRRELSPNFLLIARCDARGVAGGSVDEVIRRGKIYREAGADVVFPEGLISIDEIERCGREIGGPLVYNMVGVSPILTSEELARMNVAIAFAGNALRASLVAMIENFARLRAEGYAYLKEAPNLSLHEFAGFPEAMAWENEFLPAEQQASRYVDSLGFAPPKIRR